MHDRTYGIELEFNTDRQGGTAFAKQVIADATDGGSKWRGVSMTHDGSEIEVRSPAMQGQADMDELKIVMDALRKAGCKVTTVDGMHVHHGAADLAADKDKRIRVAKSWLNNQDHVYAMVAKRRDNSDVCMRINQNCLDRIALAEDGRAPYIDRYYGLNMVPLGRATKTVEFRIHQGSLQSKKAEAWINFGQAFLARATREEIAPVEDPKDFLMKLEVPDTCAETLLRAAARRLNETPTKMSEYVAAFGGRNGGRDVEDD